MFIDLHVHSHYSAGVDASPSQILELAKKYGLDGVAFTERGSTRDADKLVEAGKGSEVAVFVGLELPTDCGVLLCYPREIDDFVLEEQWRRLVSVGTPKAQQVIDLFVDKGGAVMAAYPYDTNMPWPMADRIFELENLSAVEGYVPRLAVSRNAFAVEAALAMGLPSGAGSDYRGGDDIGIAATIFAEPVQTQAELVDALKAGQFWAAAVGVDVVDQRSSSSRGSSKGRRGGRRGSKRSSKRGGRGRGRRGRASALG